MPLGRSPTAGLLVGLVLTLAAVVAYTWYINRQIASLRVLQSDLVDRNRRDSLQLLRVQNNLNQLGLAMRDMLDDDHAYPLVAWSAQFQRIRGDLDDALKRQTELAGRRTPDRDRLTDSLAAVLGCCRSDVRACRRRQERRGADAGVVVAPGPAGGARHGGGAAARREQRGRGAGGRAGAGDLRPGAAAGLSVFCGDARRNHGDRPLRDPLEPAALRASSRRSRTAAASLRSNSSRRASRRSASCRASCTTRSGRS